MRARPSTIVHVAGERLRLLGGKHFAALIRPAGTLRIRWHVFRL